MKKLFSSIIMVMMIALAFTLVASAEDTVYKHTNGLYNIDYAIDAADGTQFGMVVIEATDSAATFTLDEGTIRYIDQVGAANGKLTFDSFAPMELKSEGTSYEVYIGGGSLGEAKHIGTLSLEADEDPTIAVTSVTLDKSTAEVEVGKTITLAATVLPDNATDKTVVWSASNAKATVEDGVVTGVEAGEVVITATAGDKSAECTVTVTASQEDSDPEGVLGDLNGKDGLTTADAVYFVQHMAFPAMFPINYEGTLDFNGKDGVTTADAVYLVQHIAFPAMFPLRWN